MWINKEQKEEGLKALREGIKEIYGTMSDFKERMTEEQMQLDEKINKLENFILSNDFRMLDPIQQSLLKVQLMSMRTYSQCLIERVSAL